MIYWQGVETRLKYITLKRFSGPYTFFTLSQWAKHLSHVSRKSLKEYRIYGTDTKRRLKRFTFKYNLASVNHLSQDLLNLFKECEQYEANTKCRLKCFSSKRDPNRKLKPSIVNLDISQYTWLMYAAHHLIKQIVLGKICLTNTGYWV